MGYEIELNEADGTIVGRYVGEMVFEDRVALARSMVEHVTRNPLLRILIDATHAINALTEEQEIAFGEWLAEHAGHFRETKVAVVDNKPEEQQLAVSIAYAGGFHRIAQFDRHAEAMQWLAEDGR